MSESAGGPLRRFVSWTKTLPVLGWLVRLAHALLRTPYWHQRIEALQAELNRLAGLQDRLLLAQEAMRQDILLVLGGRLDGVDGHLDGVDGHLDGVDGRLDEVDGHLDGVNNRLVRIEYESGRLRADWRATLARSEAAQRAALEAMLRRRATDAGPEPVMPNIDRNVLYRRFEDACHKDWKVRERKTFYLPRVKTAQQYLGGGLLDIGCGRGEWLEILQQAGVPALGVDLNPAMIEAARVQGLDVALADALEFLHRSEPNRYAILSAFHLVEHLAPEILLALLDAAKRALQPGGLLILETPNPENLLVGACNFWLDDTHRQPLPPDLLNLTVTGLGFEKVRVLRFYLQADLTDRMTEDEPAPSFLEPEKWLRAAYDYAIIAQKPER